MSSLTKVLFVYGLISIIFLSHYCYGQDQQIADSLITVYETGDDADTSKYKLLNDIAFNSTKPEVSEYYASLLIDLAEANSSKRWLMSGYLQFGNAQSLKGDLNSALESYYKCMEYALEIENDETIGAVNIAIANTYSEIGNSTNAIQYYKKGIELLRETNDSISLGKALLNAGDEYFFNEKYDSALNFFEESAMIFKLHDLPEGIAYNLGNKGMVYAKTGKSQLAEININEAIEILEELQDYYPISVYLTYMSDIYLERGEEQNALNYALRSLDLARQYGLKKQISESNLKLSVLYENLGQNELSFSHYKSHIAYRDSVNNIEIVQNMADLRTDFEVAQKQMEVDLLNQKQKNQRIVIIATASTLVLILLLAIGLAHRYRYIRKTKNIIQEEKNRSEKLLLNILPEHTADELKANGRVQAKKFSSATVLFTDFKEFTKTAEHSEPEKLVDSIDFYFKAFDEITTKYGLEKIKTIGDSYMCAGGLPTESDDHPLKVVQAALEMVDFSNQLNDVENNGLIKFELRIGIHTGPVIAGIVGNKKWQYDIWGDTVNIASRMESNSIPGKINLSETTYQMINHRYDCEYRGEIEVKNRGSLKMYYLKEAISEGKPTLV